MDFDKKTKAISLFAKTFDCTFKKLDPNDIDYKLFNKDGELIRYVDITVRNRVLRDAFPLPIPIRRISKLADKRLTGVLIWACDDGIMYARIDHLYGTIKMGGMAEKANPHYDVEMMAYFDKQDAVKYIRY